MANVKNKTTEQDCVICLCKTIFIDDECQDCGNRQIDSIIKNAESQYLLEKIAILEIDDKVVFEQGQLIYEVFLRDNGDYEYSCYDFKDFISGDSLETSDGGICTGTAHDAVYMAIGM